MKISRAKFKQKNVAIKSGKKDKIPNECFKCDNLIYENGYYRCDDSDRCNDISMHYHLGWLKLAVDKHQKSDIHIKSVDGNMTIDEYIKMFMKDELNEVIKL